MVSINTDFGSLNIGNRRPDFIEEEIIEEVYEEPVYNSEPMSQETSNIILGVACLVSVVYFFFKINDYYIKDTTENFRRRRRIVRRVYRRDPYDTGYVHRTNYNRPINHVTYHNTSSNQASQEESDYFVNIIMAVILLVTSNNLVQNLAPEAFKTYIYYGLNFVVVSVILATLYGTYDKHNNEGKPDDDDQEES